MNALLVAPVFDEITQYSLEFSREILQKLEEKGYNIIDLSNSTITKKDVEKHLSSIDLFIFYNHGSEDALWGSREEAVINLNNCHELSGKEVYTLACLSAKKLGIETWRNNAKVFWGYCKEVSFTTDALDEFKQFFNSGLLFRLDGKGWKECYSLASLHGQELTKKLVTEGKFIAAVLMSQNVSILRCYNAEPPPTTCQLRKLALKLFGSRKGWFITRVRGVSTTIFFIGFGTSLYDFIRTLYELGGYREVLSLKVGYIGLLTVLIAFLMNFKDFLRSLNMKK